MEAPLEAFKLKGKICVVVGGTGLIGAQISRQLAAQEASVVVVGRDEAKGQALIGEISASGGVAAFVSCDVTDEASVDSLASEVYERFGAVHGLINCAHFGTGKPGKTPFEVEYGDFLSYLNRNAGSPFLVARAFAKQMMLQKQGSIVFLGSIYGEFAPKFEVFDGTSLSVRAEYGMAKAGIAALSRYFAKWLAPYNIRVNTIAPGAVAREGQDERFVRQYNTTVPLGGRMASPEDIAPLAAYLVSDASQYVTGQEIVVDGGWSL